MYLAPRGFHETPRAHEHGWGDARHSGGSVSAPCAPGTAPAAPLHEEGAGCCSREQALNKQPSCRTAAMLRQLRVTGNCQHRKSPADNGFPAGCATLAAASLTTALLTGECRNEEDRRNAQETPQTLTSSAEAVSKANGAPKGCGRRGSRSVFGVGWGGRGKKPLGLFR